MGSKRKLNQLLQQHLFQTLDLVLDEAVSHIVYNH